MKNYEKYQPEAEKFNAVDLPTPDELADAIVEDISDTVKTTDKTINRGTLKKSIINAFAKLGLITIVANDDDDDDEQDAPVDPAVARKEILESIINSILESFEILDIPKKPLAAMVATNAALAAEESFDKYFIR